jgi:hypothetical protein
MKRAEGRLIQTMMIGLDSIENREEPKSKKAHGLHTPGTASE